MNRVGFLLLAIGVILAALGWFYDEPTYTGIGLIPLLILYLLATTFPDVIDYKHSRYAATMPTAMRWIWRWVAALGAVVALLALWHSTVSGWTGLPPLAAAAAALCGSIVWYTVVNDARVSQWRESKAAKRSRRSEAPGA